MIGINKATINQGAVSLQLVYIETEHKRIGKIALFSVIYEKVKVLRLIWVYYNLRPSLVR